MTTPDSPVSSLSDEQLVVHVNALVERERRATAALIAALAEMAARRLYLPLGYSSLQQYCVDALHLSPDAAADRIEAARAALKYPSILDHLNEGSITLSSLRLLVPSLTDDNHAALLDAARHKSKREVAAMAASLRPHTLPYRTVITPASGDEFRLQVTLSQETHDKLRRAQDLLSHAVPDGDVSVVLDRALSLLIKDLERKKAGVTRCPRRARTRIPGSRTVPAAVRRAVWARDGGRCAFVGTERRCDETKKVQFHHVFPESEDGPPTIENVELRCAAHNRFEWDVFVEDLEVSLDDLAVEDPTGPGTGSTSEPVRDPRTEGAGADECGKKTEAGDS